MLKLILGRNWTVNSQEILSLIAKDVKQQRSGIILMVPELISHDTERRLCEAAGDAASRYAEVLSFPRLAKRVSDSVCFGIESCLDNGGRIVAMASAAQHVRSKLKVFASCATRPEFLSGLVDAIDEFKRCCISPADLMESSKKTQGSFAQKLEELSLLYESYNALCENGKKDPRDQMTWLLGELQDSNFGSKHTFYVDGFPDFTRQHMFILMHLLTVSPCVTVSLNCDSPGSNLMGFEKAGDTAAQLLRFVKDKGIPYEIHVLPDRDDCLLPVRNYLFQGEIVDQNRVDVVSAYCAETVYQECQIALEKTLEIVQNGGRFRDIAIVCTDTELYVDPLNMLFKRGGIPLYISGTEDILQKPVMATVLAALDVALGGFEQQDVLRYLKSALSPLTQIECNLLENYVLLWGINGTKWKKTWTAHPDGLGKEIDEAALKRLDELNALRSLAIDPLTKLQEEIKKTDAVSVQVDALYNYLNTLKMEQRLSFFADELELEGDYRGAQILNQLWDILLEALDQLRDVLGDLSWDADNFNRLLKLLLSQYDVGTIPSVLDAVIAGPVSAMRCQRCAHLILLGACEGSLPRYGTGSGILTDQERTELRQLGVPLTGGALEGLQAEFAEIYGVFCGASESVCAVCSGNQPSFLFRRMSQLAKTQQRDCELLGAALGNAEDAAAYLFRYGAADIADKLGISDDYKAVAEKVSHKMGEVSANGIEELYGSKLYLSASQVDKIAQCRMAYFLGYGIRLDERKPAELDPAEFGTYVHTVLENTVREVGNRGGFEKVPLEQMLQIAREFSRSYIQDHFAQIDSQRMEYLFDRNAYELEMIVCELWEELRNSDFEPVGFEVAFGKDRDVPYIDVSGKKMPAYLRGFVDRVDLWDDGEKKYFRIVDYKTGKKDFDYCDVSNGYGLQMLLYLFALEQGGEKLLGHAPQAAGVQYFPARVPHVSADGRLTEEEANKEREKLWKRKGLLLEDVHVLDAMEHGFGRNRLPLTLKKDGSICGDLASIKQLKLLKSFVYALVGKLVDDIASGCVEPNPYSRGSSYDACTYCPYGAVCHKEQVTGRRDFKAISASSFWEQVEKEVGTHG